MKKVSGLSRMQGTPSSERRTAIHYRRRRKDQGYDVSGAVSTDNRGSNGYLGLVIERRDQAIPVQIDSLLSGMPAGRIGILD